MAKKRTAPGPGPGPGLHFVIVAAIGDKPFAQWTYAPTPMHDKAGQVITKEAYEKRALTDDAFQGFAQIFPKFSAINALAVKAGLPAPYATATLTPATDTAKIADLEAKLNALLAKLATAK